jgi:WXXGXW repeat (2 copies)
MKNGNTSTRRRVFASIRPALGAAAVLAILATSVPATAQVYVRVGPPAARVEVVPPRPGPGYVWRPGYWAWRHRWVWVGGRYLRGPHPHAAWVPGHWAHRPRGWVWINGHWR